MIEVPSDINFNYDSCVCDSIDRSENIQQLDNLTVIGENNQTIQVQVIDLVNIETSNIVSCNNLSHHNLTNSFTGM